MLFRQSRRRRRPASFVVGLALLIALQSATPVRAWGRLGHRVIARIAEGRLSPEAKRAIKAPLPEGESLADASTWADEHRREMPKTRPGTMSMFRSTNPSMTPSGRQTIPRRAASSTRSTSFARP